MFVFGDPKAFATFQDALSAPLQGMARYVGPTPPEEADLRRDVADRVNRMVQSRREEEEQEFHDRRAQGRLVALGPSEVLQEMDMGRVARLFLSADTPVEGGRCVACGVLRTGQPIRCTSCGGESAPASLVQEVVSRGLTHPPLPMTFVPETAEWLRDLGGMAALLTSRGRKT